MPMESVTQPVCATLLGSTGIKKIINCLSCSMEGTSFFNCTLNCTMQNKVPNSLPKPCMQSSKETIVDGPMFTMILFKRKKFSPPSMVGMVRRRGARKLLTQLSFFPDTWLPTDCFFIPALYFRSGTGTEPSLPFMGRGTGLMKNKKDTLLHLFLSRM